MGQAARSRLAGLRPPALALLYGVAWLLAFQISTSYWFLPGGLRFAALWLSPSRRWGWFALADVVAILIANRDGNAFHTWAGFALATFVPWCACALAALMVRPGGVYAAPESPGRMGSLLGAMLMAATLDALAQSSMHVLEGRRLAAQWFDAGFGTLVGEYVGMLMLVPVCLQVLQSRSGGEEWRRMWAELAISFLPLLGLFAFLLAMHSAVASYAGLLALLPMMVMAFRHGWRGASWAIALTSLALYLAHTRFDLQVSGQFLQLLLALMGSVALLLGAAIGALRRVNAALIDRNRRERATNDRLAAQAEELRDLGRRLARAREDEQGRLAHELHDELGQMVTALGTRLGLIARKCDDPEVIASLHAQRELVQRIQESIREVLHALRPPVLDRFGLEAALREGPVQRLLTDAAIDFHPKFNGPIQQIGADIGSAIYRICQEAATNCVRHAQARTFTLQVDAAPAFGGGVEVHLRIEDDGVGMDPAVAAGKVGQGNGLRGIRDRVLALAGEYRCDSDSTGTRHLIWFIDRVPRTPGEA